jgi:hypothetical protein
MALKERLAGAAGGAIVVVTVNGVETGDDPAEFDACTVTL